jgi:hypothetical protein
VAGAAIALNPPKNVRPRVIVLWHAACEPFGRLRANPLESGGFDDNV